MKVAMLAVLASTLSLSAHAKDPDCTGRYRWPARLAQPGPAELEQYDLSRTRVTRIASQEISRNQFLQAYLVRYSKKDGATTEAMTLSDASREECSGGQVEIFRIARQIGTRSGPTKILSEIPGRAKSRASTPWVTLALESACTRRDQAPAALAMKSLDEAHISSPDDVDPSETIVTRLVSQQVGKDIFRQVNLVLFAKKSGEAIRAITVSDVSHQQCLNETGADVYLVDG